jgi:molecular chaperone DnaK (HSP70)
VLIGKEALNQIVVNPLSTIYEVKRLMGRSFYDVDSRKFLYRVRPTLKSQSVKGKRAVIDIPCEGYPNKLIQPELISALILNRAAEIAQKELGITVKDVIISVPAQFDDAQRKATMDAGRIAGLNPKKIVNEPIVAAFAAAAFEDDLRGTEDAAKLPEPTNTRASVVVDIGGGTSDFSFMEILGSYYKVVTTDGNKTLGGRDIDIRLATIMTDIFQKKLSGRGVNFESPEFQQNLRIECEKAKRKLSSMDNYTLEVKVNVASQESVSLTHFLNRSDFESYISDILHAMIKPLDSLLSRGSTTRAHIVDLYLVGGIVQIPKLQELLRQYFPNVTDDNIHDKNPVQVRRFVCLSHLFPHISSACDLKSLFKNVHARLYHPGNILRDFQYVVILNELYIDRVYEKKFAVGNIP